jgi:major membrane immunogen (membrane-anchored lipoprotein)
MKSIKHISFAIVLALTTILSSCSSSDDGGGGFNGPATGNFLKASNFMSEGSTTSGSYNSGALVLQGVTTAGKSINIQLYALDGTLETGTFNVSATNESDAYTGSLTYIEVNTSTFTAMTYNSQLCDNANGTIVITHIDSDKIEGTFSFTGKELREDESCSGGTKSITNGSFRLEL